MKAIIEDNAGKLDSIHPEKATFRGSMNNIKFVIEATCDVSLLNGGIEKEKLISFFYCPNTDACYCFHDAELNFYDCSSDVIGLKELKHKLASVLLGNVN